jgi:hypothetical protein
MGRSDDDRNEHHGGVLGLGDTGSSITDQESGQPSRPAGATEEAGRRRRMSEGADELTPSSAAEPHQGGSGATGIDMGAGGEGTDLE